MNLLTLYLLGMLPALLVLVWEVAWAVMFGLWGTDYKDSWPQWMKLDLDYNEWPIPFVLGIFFAPTWPIAAPAIAAFILTRTSKNKNGAEPK